MIEIAHLTKFSLDTGFLKKIAYLVLEKEGYANFDLSIVVVGPKKMKELNWRYRSENKTANVLSFSFFPPLLGEIFLCPQQVKKEAKNYDMTFPKALAFMLVHGILHIIGYNHEKNAKEAQRMEKKEQLYLSILNTRYSH